MRCGVGCEAWYVILGATSVTGRTFSLASLTAAPIAAVVSAAVPLFRRLARGSGAAAAAAAAAGGFWPADCAVDDDDEGGTGIGMGVSEILCSCGLGFVEAEERRRLSSAAAAWDCEVGIGGGRIGV